MTLLEFESIRLLFDLLSRMFLLSSDILLESILLSLKGWVVGLINGALYECVDLLLRKS